MIVSTRISYELLRLHGIYIASTRYPQNQSVPSQTTPSNAIPCKIQRSISRAPALSTFSPHQHVYPSASLSLRPIPHLPRCPLISRLHIAPPIPRQSSPLYVLWRANALVQSRMRVLIAAVVVEDATCDDAEVLGEVQGSGDDEEAKNEEEH